MSLGRCSRRLTFPSSCRPRDALLPAVVPGASSGETVTQQKGRARLAFTSDQWLQPCGPSLSLGSTLSVGPTEAEFVPVHLVGLFLKETGLACGGAAGWEEPEYTGEGERTQGVGRRVRALTQSLEGERWGQ